MADSGAPAAWTRQLGPRLLRLMWLKSSGTMVILWVFFAVYLHIMKNPAYPVLTMPVTRLDEWIAFFPPALPIYASLWVYLSLVPSLLLGLRELLAYGVWIVLLCCAGLLIHYFWPTKVPPHDIGEGQFWGFAMLRGVDAGGNACPSLHVATAVFAAMWCDRLLPGMNIGWRGRVGNAIWFLAITWSTMATRQHVAIDVAAGLVLGVVFGAASLWRRPLMGWHEYQRSRTAVS